MEARARNYILDKIVGLLQTFKARLPAPKTSEDIESGLSNATRPSPLNDALHPCSGCETCNRNSVSLSDNDPQGTTSRSNGRIESGINQQPQCVISPSMESIELEIYQQPHFTEGPARFVIANDGSKDCMALLVTDELIAKLRDLYEDDHHLSGKRGPLDYARREARTFETSTVEIKESIETAESPEEAEKLQEMVRRQEPRLLKKRQRRDEKSVKQLERNITSSKAYIHWVLDTAMKEADLLEAHRSLTPVTMTDIESESGTQEKIQQKAHEETDTENGRHDAAENVTDIVESRKQHSAVLANTEDVSEELQSHRQAAWDSYNEALMNMHEVQALFDDRQQSYETDLADYEEGFANGIYNISRSEFDRSKIRYGQEVTRALIDAEEEFEATKEQARAVGAIGSDYDDATDCYGCYEESWPENELASYLATKDWSHVLDWLGELPEPSRPEEMGLEAPDVDDWYADEIDPADSISQIDFDDSRKNIDRWENIRFDRWEEMRTQVNGPEVQMGFLVRSIETLKRRHSVSLCRSDAGEWDP
ncbi:hypothetical protein IMSHALPRED_003223 [Imshaugia aleurites]|uniref:Uncharacterized protein n=1 Tax=Imshaugia aleurites TaxID=172621 RepID=A0A8H3II72_9LECA|nr:hypothetical protein IMSHALPRED_003223 [Imshaugia aleurites]